MRKELIVRFISAIDQLADIFRVNIGSVFFTQTQAFVSKPSHQLEGPYWHI